MINFKITQDTKNTIYDTSGIAYVNFLEKDIQIRDAGNAPTGIDYFLVSKDNAMRIDLIAKSMYGNTDPIEKILKFNGISNPLSIDVSDILIVFDLYSLTNNMRDPNGIAKLKTDVRKQYLSPEKASKTDPKLKDFAKRTPPKIDEGPSGNALPPNYANFGDQEIQVRNGKLYFGPNVSKGQDACEEPLSKSEFIARLIKNRINK
jgi:hypothetical protein